MAKPADVQAYQELIDTDPEIQAALAQVEQMRAAGVPLVKPGGSTGGPSLMKWAQDNLVPILKRKLDERGMEKPNDWGISLGGDGKRVGELNRKGFLDRNIDWIAPVIVGGVGAAGGIGALAGAGGAGGGAAGAAGGAGALASTAPAVGSVGFAAPATSALGAGGAAAGGGAVAGGGILSSLLSNPETYSTVSTLLGNMGKGAGLERGDQNRFSQDRDRLVASLFNTQQSAASRAKEAEETGKINRSELESRNASAEEDAKRYRSQLGITAPAARTRQSLWGSMIQNIQPVSVNVPDRLKDSLVTYEGGLSPALINDMARDSGAELQRQAHSALLNRSDIPSMTQLPTPPPMTDFSTALLTPPEQTPYRQPGAFETGTSAGATAASIGGIVAALLARNKNRVGGSMEPPETAGG